MFRPHSEQEECPGISPGTMPLAPDQATTSKYLGLETPDGRLPLSTVSRTSDDEILSLPLGDLKSEAVSPLIPEGHGDSGPTQAPVSCLFGENLLARKI